MNAAVGALTSSTRRFDAASAELSVRPRLPEDEKDAANNYVAGNTGWPKRTEACGKSS